MTELLTAAQMRAIEQAAIESGEVTGLELMERAGRGVVEAVLEEWPEMAVAPQRAVVLCGPGNNGGDGFVVARLLKDRGWEVEVFLYGEVEKLPPDAKVNAERWLEVGEVEPFDDDAFDDDPLDQDSLDLIVDGLFGTGLKRVAQIGNFYHYIEDIVEYHESDAKTVAIDIPSGLDSDSGRVFPVEGDAAPFVVLAHLTVTFHRAKLGHYLENGPQACGKLVVKDISL